MEKLWEQYGIYGLIISGLITWILMERKSARSERKEWLTEIRSIVNSHNETIKQISKRTDDNFEKIMDESHSIHRDTNAMQRETNNVIREQTNIVAQFRGIFDKIMK